MLSVWTAAYGVGLILLAYYAATVDYTSWEVTVSTSVQSWRTSWLDATMRAISVPGTFAVAAPMVLAAGAALYVKGWRAEAAFVVSTVVLGRLLNGLLKVVVDRPRPTDAVIEVLQETASASFPSGHAMHALAFFGALGIVLSVRLGPGLARLAIQAAAIVFVLAAGFSRIYLGMHWLGDVVGGYAFAGAVLGAIFWVWSWSRRRERR